MSSSTTVTLTVAAIAAAATLVAASITAVSAYLANKRDRRRTLYGEAYKAALSWHEMLYRVRRRSAGAESGLVGKFHELQDQLTFYQGWIGSESKYMARSYRRLVQAVKSETMPLINAAWAEPERPAPGNAAWDDTHPNFDVPSDAFLSDVRAYLSPWQLRKFGVLWRNRKL